MFAKTHTGSFLGIWDLPEDEILERMIYGHRFYPGKYSTLSYYIPLWNLKSMD